MEPTAPKPSPANTTSLGSSFDLHDGTLAFQAIILLTLFVWKPRSQPPSANTRMVIVSAVTTRKAGPEDSVFSLSYQNTNADKLRQADKKLLVLIAGLAIIIIVGLMGGSRVGLLDLLLLCKISKARTRFKEGTPVSVVPS